MRSADVTAVILARDEERRLPAALASLPHGMPALVLDARSHDRTAELARLAGARVVEREWTDFVDARRHALALVETPWAFALDADEVLDEALRGAIAAAPDAGNGYAVRRDTYYCGKRLRMWRGERLVRLVRASAARVEAHPAAGGDAALHERYVVDGDAPLLAGTLLHFSYDDAGTYRAKYRTYTALEAESVAPSLGAWAAAVVAAPLRFAWLLFRRGALLDGVGGWTVAWYSAWYPAAVRGIALVRR